MGRWFGAVGPWTPTFADVDPTAARTAASETGGDVLETAADRSFELVCIAVPMSAAETAIAEHAHRAERAIIDLTGDMSTALAAMQTHTATAERASFHPLFAPDNAPGSIPVVIDQPGPTIQRVIEAFEAAGNHLIETTAEEHDQAMETIQASAHAAILAYGLTAEAVPDGYETPISRELTDLLDRVTGGNPAVYAEIQDRFDGAAGIAAAADRIATADRETFLDQYRAARDAIEPADTDRNDN